MIRFAGHDITGWAPDDIFQAGISRKFQVPNMYETLSVFDNIMVSLQGRRRVFATLFQRLSGAERDRIWEILEFVELADKASDPADTLSHGERQWLELGMLIGSNPKLLLLDEPTTGMTEDGKRKTAELIRKIAKTHTVLLVEHDMHIVRQIGQRITVMHQGQTLAEGPMSEVMNNETVRRFIWERASSSDAAGQGHRYVLRDEPYPAWRLAGHGRSRAVRGPRAQRRRQDHAPAQHHRREPADGRDRSSSTAPRSRISNRTAAPGSASAMCRRAARSFPILRWRKTSTSRCSARAARARRCRASCSTTSRR